MPDGADRTGKQVVIVMWGCDVSGWGPWLGMGFGMVLFWGLIIFGAVVAVGHLSDSRDRRRSDAGGGPGGGEQILADRFARGEIGEDEYRQRRELLRESR